MTDDKKEIEDLIKEKGEKWISGAIASMTPEGFLWLCSIAEGAQLSHENAFKGAPKGADPGFSINDFIEVAQDTFMKVDERDLPMNPGALLAIIEYYRDAYGPHQGWSKFCRVLSTSHLAMKMLGKLPASATTSLSGRSGCAGIITIAMLAAFSVMWLILS